MSDEKPTDQTRTSENDIAPVSGSAEFVALQGQVFDEVDKLLIPSVEHVTEEQVSAAIRRRGINISKATMSAVIDSMAVNSLDGGPMRLRLSEIRVVRRPDGFGRPHIVFTRGRH